ncbi:MAG: hypothetical protein HQL61_13815 [Magnetococcales bacterium]|nr:hypothetical protein [Nitrospirota bacterium]
MEDVKREIVTIMFRQKKTIYVTTAIIFVFSVLVAYFWPPTYSASGSILVKAKKAEKTPGSLEKELIRTNPITKEDLATEVQILTSFDVIARTVKSLREARKYPVVVKKTADVNKEYYDLKDSIKTEITPSSSVINITFFDKNKEFATTFLKALIHEYIGFRMSVYNPESTDNFYSTQTKEYRNNLIKQEGELISSMENSKSADPVKEIENNLVLKIELEKQLNPLKTDVIDKTNLIDLLDKSINSKNTEAFKFIENVASIKQLSVALNELQLEKTNYLKRYLPESDKIILINEQISKIEARLIAEAKSYKSFLEKDLATVKQKVQNIQQRIDTLNIVNVELKKHAIQNDRLTIEKNVTNDSYTTLALRKNESNLNTALSTDFFINVITDVFPSNGAVFPKKRLLIPIGLVTGLLAGCAFGFVRDYFNNTFKTPGEIAHYANLPILFSIPKDDSA